MRAGLLALALLAALAPRGAAAQSAEEIAFVRDLLLRVLPLSYDKGIEHCGYVGRDASGALVATGPQPGTLDACSSPWPEGLPGGIEVVASWHTHGAFVAGYHGELPSDLDMRSDRNLGIMGWLGTPGGRLWYIDSERMVTKQVCGAGCLPVDPAYEKARAGEIAKGYSYEELLRRLAQR